jgi:Family of unknown function (DUF5343)
VADKHPYTPGGSGGIVQIVTQLRKSFPAKVSSETLKKLGIASNNESYIINILKFLKVIDEQGQQTAEAKATFSQHEDAEFQEAFSNLVRSAYSGLFHLQGEDAWTLPGPKLITYFRNTDQTSSVVGARQSQTFQTLAALGGHGDAPTAKQSGPKAANDKKKPVVRVKKADAESAVVPPTQVPAKTVSNGVAMTVRIEINLPAAGDQETYDKIFKSIRENLLRGE